MKTLVITAALAAAVLAGTGVANADSWTADQGFIASLDRGGVNDRVPSAAIELGHAYCDALNAGITPREIIASGLQNGIDAHDSGYILGSAVQFYCPQFSADL